MIVVPRWWYNKLTGARMVNGKGMSAKADDVDISVVGDVAQVNLSGLEIDNLNVEDYVPGSLVRMVLDNMLKNMVRTEIVSIEEIQDELREHANAEHAHWIQRFVWWLTMLEDVPEELKVKFSSSLDTLGKKFCLENGFPVDRMKPFIEDVACPVQ